MRKGRKNKQLYINFILAIPNYLIAIALNICDFFFEIKKQYYHNFLTTNVHRKYDVSIIYIGAIQK